jgi:hypothetical protein
MKAIVLITIASLMVASPVLVQAQIPPHLQTMFDTTDALLVVTDPNNQQFKDQQWNPPQGSTPEEMGQNLFQICQDQASQMNVYDTIGHCNAIGSNCQQNQMDIIECYANHMTNWNIIPPEILASVNQKLDTSSIAIDNQYRMTMCPAADGTYGDYC